MIGGSKVRISVATFTALVAMKKLRSIQYPPDVDHLSHMKSTGVHWKMLTISAINPHVRLNQNTIHIVMSR